VKKIGQDKWKHFFVGILMGIVLQTFVWFLFPERTTGATIIAFAFVIIISYGFELYSKFTGQGHYELMDAIAAIIGGVLGMSAVLLFELKIFS
jgi:hypothetical protein